MGTHLRAFFGRFILALITAFALAGLAAPAAAHAAAPPAEVTALPTIDACLGDPPVPEDPAANGVISTVLGPSANYKPADPFTPGSGTSILEQYGTAGTTFSVYDTGCTPGSDVAPGGYATAANFLLSFPKFTLGIIAVLGNSALEPTWLHALDEPIAQVGQSLWSAITQPWAATFVLITAVIVIMSAWRARLGAAAGMVLFVCIGLTIAALPFHKTSVLTDYLDHLVSAGSSAALTGSTTAAAGDAPGTAIMARPYDVAVYDRFLDGELCSSTSQTAKTYGPRLFKAQAFTWDESRKARASVSAYEAAVQQKQSDWRAVASQIKDADPVAYQCLTGNRGQDRLGAAAVANLVTVSLVPFLAAVLIMCLGAYMIFRFLVGYSPVIGTLLILPPMHSMLRTVGEVIVASVVNTIVFAAAGWAVISVSNSLLTSGMNQFLAVILIAILSAIAWIMLRPFRTLTRMVRNPGNALQGTLDAPGDAVARMKKMAGKVAGTAIGTSIGSTIGNVAADRVRQDDVAAPADEPVEQDTPVWLHAERAPQPALNGRVQAGPAVAASAAPAAGHALPEPPLVGEVVPDDTTLDRTEGAELPAHRYAHPMPAYAVPAALPAGSLTGHDTEPADTVLVGDVVVPAVPDAPTIATDDDVWLILEDPTQPEEPIAAEPRPVAADDTGWDGQW